MASSSSRSTLTQLVNVSLRPHPIAHLSRRYATPAKTPKASKSPKSASSSDHIPSLVEDFVIPEIHLGPTHQSRYHEHYDNTLSSDLLYMSYDHKLANRPPPAPLAIKPMTAYEINRPGLNIRLPTHPRLIKPSTVPQLESVIIHCMVKEAVANKANLLTGIMALRAISGESPNGGGRPGSSGVQILKARVGAASFKLREGMPLSAKVELKGDAMYDFIGSLVDFVLPRLREYYGAPIPPQSGFYKSTARSGVVSFGLPREAMALFPQIEANLESYPRMHGMHLYFKTNAKGDGAEAMARTLMSGFRVPFHRP